VRRGFAPERQNQAFRGPLELTARLKPCPDTKPPCLRIGFCPGFELGTCNSQLELSHVLGSSLCERLHLLPGRLREFAAALEQFSAALEQIVGLLDSILVLAPQ